MSAHNTPEELHSSYLQIPDPGDAGTITVQKNLAIVPLESSGAETRTLNRPTEQGIYVTLHMKADGGDITLTVTGGYNESGDTTLTFSDVGQVANFVSCYDGTDYYWRLISLPFPASLAESLTDATKTLTLADHDKTFFLNRAGGITITMPSPQLGFRCRFVVGTAPTSTGYVINSAGGADIMVLGVNELEVDTSNDGPYDDNADTITLVSSVAVVGDFLQVECDGTKFYFTGQTNADGGVTSSTT